MCAAPTTNSCSLFFCHASSVAPGKQCLSLGLDKDWVTLKPSLIPIIPPLPGDSEPSCFRLAMADALPLCQNVTVIFLGKILSVCGSNIVEEVWFIGDAIVKRIVSFF